MRLAALIVLLISFYAPCSAAPKAERHTAPRGVNLYSRAHEMELGKDLARDVERSSRLLEDPIVLEYINRLAQNLTQQADCAFSVRIQVIRSEEANSVALPGGYIFINSGLIRAADTEAELAVAIAHEIGHVAARHYTRQATMGDLLGIASVPLIFVGGWPGMMIREGISLGTPVVMSKLSRGAEAEADRLGMTYLFEAGYDPTAFVDFLERLSRIEKARRTGPAGILSTHPGLGSRIRAAQKQIQKDLYPRSEYLIQTSEFEVIKARLAAIEKGVRVSRDPVRPPTSMGGERPVLRRPE